MRSHKPKGVDRRPEHKWDANTHDAHKTSSGSYAQKYSSKRPPLGFPPYLRFWRQRLRRLVATLHNPTSNSGLPRAIRSLATVGIRRGGEEVDSKDVYRNITLHILLDVAQFFLDIKMPVASLSPTSYCPTRGAIPALPVM